jgi:hypothetical protein
MNVASRDAVPVNRRSYLQKSAYGLGALALSHLLSPSAAASGEVASPGPAPPAPKPSGSSAFSNRAAHRISTSSTISRDFKRSSTRISLTPFAKASESPAWFPARRACPCNQANTPSTKRAGPVSGGVNSSPTPDRSPTDCASCARCTPKPSTTTRLSRSSRRAANNRVAPASDPGSTTASAAPAPTSPRSSS